LPKILRAIAMERCIGCYSCMLGCARLVHNSLSLIRSGIHVRSLGGLTAGFEARYCLACRPAFCALACPTGAFVQREGGGVCYRERLCIRCGHCARACPVNVILVDEETGFPVVCLQCGSCVNFCPHGCLAMVDAPSKEQPGTAGTAGEPDIKQR
jgi:Fe-S-cluster-containing dehydrogenase component